MDSKSNHLFSVLNIGTSAQMAVIVQKSFIQNSGQRMSPAIQFFPYFDGHYLAVAASLNGKSLVIFTGSLFLLFFLSSLSSLFTLFSFFSVSSLNVKPFTSALSSTIWCTL